MMQVDAGAPWLHLCCKGIATNIIICDFEYPVTDGSHLNGSRKCDVVARGFAGYNSHMCSAVLPVVMGEFDPSMIVGVTIFLGANDANFKDLNPIQHVSLTEYTENLRHMVLFLEVDSQHFHRSQGVSRKKVTLIGPPAFNGAEWAKELECRGLGMPLSKDNEITGIYAQACESLANELNCDCVNLWKAMMDRSEEEWKAMLCDGLHLSQKGSQFLFNLLQPMIEERTNTLPLILPEWRDMKESTQVPNPAPASPMNWMGGSRSRIRKNEELRKQKAFFEKQRLRKKMEALRDPRTPSSDGVSQDLLHLRAVSQLVDESVTPRQGGTAQQGVNVVNLMSTGARFGRRRGKSGKLFSLLDLIPASPDDPTTPAQNHTGSSKEQRPPMSEHPLPPFQRSSFQSQVQEESGESNTVAQSESLQTHVKKNVEGFTPIRANMDHFIQVYHQKAPNNSRMTDHIGIHTSATAFISPWPLAKYPGHMPKLKDSDAKTPKVNQSQVTESIFKTPNIQVKSVNQDQNREANGVTTTLSADITIGSKNDQKKRESRPRDLAWREKVQSLYSIFQQQEYMDYLRQELLYDPNSVCSQAPSTTEAQDGGISHKHTEQNTVEESNLASIERPESETDTIDRKRPDDQLSHQWAQNTSQVLWEDEYRPPWIKVPLYNCYKGPQERALEPIADSLR
ncbi:unnamed protein product, partial [Darwinula stevensoni]